MTNALVAICQVWSALAVVGAVTVAGGLHAELATIFMLTVEVAPAMV